MTFGAYAPCFPRRGGFVHLLPLGFEILKLPGPRGKCEIVLKGSSLHVFMRPFPNILICSIFYEPLLEKNMPTSSYVRSKKKQSSTLRKNQRNSVYPKNIPSPTSYTTNESSTPLSIDELDIELPEDFEDFEEPGWYLGGTFGPVKFLKVESLRSKGGKIGYEYAKPYGMNTTFVFQEFNPEDNPEIPLVDLISKRKEIKEDEQQKEERQKARGYLGWGLNTVGLGGLYGGRRTQRRSHKKRSTRRR